MIFIFKKHMLTEGLILILEETLHLKTAGGRKKVVRKYDDLPDIFKLYYSSPVGGHSGVNSIMEISRVNYWRNMAHDICHYVCTHLHFVYC